MKLVLFDIDGVLLKPKSVEFDYWGAIVKKHFGLAVRRDDIYMEGKTDRGILYELLKSAGVEDSEADPLFKTAIDDIGNVVAQGIKGKQLRKVENVEELVQRLIKDGHVIGILSGNTGEKAKVKLESAGLWKYFRFGAFGDASKRRSELVPIALERARHETGFVFDRGDVYIIGDTIRDVQCARDAGVKSIIVATGNEGMDELRKARPDHLFRDFNALDEIMAVIK
ncbi:MAG: HAD hydrolase-like protein [Candidatus Altiarchaeota archaeon]